MSWSVVIHGGAGSISRTRPVHLEETEMRAAVRKAVAIVKRETRGSLRSLSPRSPDSLAAAVEAVLHMENSEHFNAGKGSCLNRAGICELEAAVMVGNTRSSGACCGITTVKNPILLAEHVRINTPHTMIGFEGAEQLAREAGLETVDQEWFLEGRRQRQLKVASEKKKIVRDHDMEGDTVGALVLDSDGILAGAVSTGGVTNKFVGRIGDSPCIGSGLYATPLAAACGSGTGEHFVQSNLCGLVCHAMQYGGMSLQQALDAAMAEMPDDCGGIIALDAQGHVAIDFNCGGFFTAHANSEGVQYCGTFKN